MSSKDLRLRLYVRRHAVPEVKLVWPCTVSDDLTIAKLLAQVNEVVPLESGDWGLEDYVVELTDSNGGSFECLHFQQVGKVFKEDDQIIIRSLLTDDHKRRRLNGRHQISSDGKHLIDGLAFGRPWLRTPRDRPTLDLPPLKRARLTYEEEQLDDEDEDEDYQPEQLLLEGPEDVETDEPSSIGIRVLFDDADEESDLDALDDEEMDEVNYDPASDDHIDAEQLLEEDDGEESSDDEEDDEVMEDLDEELRLLRQDNAIVGDDLADDVPIEQSSKGDFSDHEKQVRIPRRNLVEEESPEDEENDKEQPVNGLLASLDHITALRSAYPLTSVSSIQSEFVRNKHNLRKTHEALSKSNDPTMSFDEMMELAIFGSQIESGLLAEESTEFKGFDTQEPESPEPVLFPTSKRPLIEVLESARVYDAHEIDERFQEDSEENRRLDAEERAIAEDSSADFTSPDEDEEASEEESSSESESEEEDSSESEDSDDSSGDDNAGSSGVRPNAPDFFENTFEGLSSEDSDSSDSESDSDDAASLNDKNKSNAEAAESASDDSSCSSDDSSSSSEDSDSDSDSVDEPEEASSKPTLPSKSTSQPELKLTKGTQNSTAGANTTENLPGQGLSRTQKRNARRREAKRFMRLKALESQSTSASDAGDEDSELLARKQALLNAFTEQVPEIEMEDAGETNGRSDLPKEAVEEVVTAEGAPEIAPEIPPESTPEVHSEQTPTTADSGSRRLKVDMGAGRRLLFGALGLKNPKSKADEEKLRKDLMKDVKTLSNTRVQEHEDKANGSNGYTQEQEPEDPDAWKQSVIYRAVECCHEGMVLSEPPFPFAQRWDPQQQYGSMRKRKRDSQNFYDDSYYDDSYYDEGSQWNDDSGVWDAGPKKSKKKRKSKGNAAETHEHQAPADEDVVLNYDDKPTGPPPSSQFTDVDDLPSLPADVKTLPTVKIDDVKPGMVLTWNQLLMSKATNWQPQIGPVTGLVLSVRDDSVDVVLAKRDREPEDKEYDPHTGKRVYDRFEAPVDEEDDVEDDGRRGMQWIDMFDARVVQQAPSPSVVATPAKNGVKPREQDHINKVSPRQQREEEHMAEELDTQEVRAEMELEMEGTVAKGGTDSASIPSAQQPPALDLPPNELPTIVSAEMDTVNSPTRQLEETALSALKENNELNAHQIQTTEPDEMEVDLPQNFDEDSAEVIIPDSLIDHPTEGLKPEDKNPKLTPVEYPQLAVPSSVGSIHSGRQPPSNYEFGEHESLELVEDSAVADTTPRASQSQKTPTRLKRSNSEMSRLSSSPLPSLEEIFHTAATSRQTTSPMKSTQQSVLTSMRPVKRDLEYEEAMRRLDEGDESDQSTGRNKSIRSLFPNATQPEPSTDPPDLPELASLKAETPVKAQPRKREKKSPFKIPEGSQVVTLSSSPASVAFSEHYANDSIDETYKGSPLPKGSGWVQKKATKRELPRRSTRSRGKSLPATVEGDESVGTEPKPASQPNRGRRKTSWKF